MNHKLLMLVILTLGTTSVSSLQAAEKTSRGLYLGIFGGGGVSDNNNFTQSGVAYKRTDHAPFYKEDYDLYVDTKGKADSNTAAIGGLHIGYEWSEIPLGNNQSGWGIRPALEVEGFYLGSSQSGNLINPRAERGVPLEGPYTGVHDFAANSHTFTDTFNVDMGVLLTNGIFTFNTPWSDKIFPYIGGGIGAAITSLSHANSTQTSNPLMPTGYEPGINHFNSNSNASSSSFATQAKAGLRVELIDKLSVFAEYRYLHVSASNYTFGSTVYPTEHAETSSWDSHFGSLNFHTGIFGIEYGF
jgi:opacity protein-like surface antigen